MGIAIGLAPVTPAAVEAQGSDLFAPLDRRPASLDLPATELDDASVVRHRLVRIDLERLHRAREAASKAGEIPGAVSWMQAVTGETDLAEAVTLARGI